MLILSESAENRQEQFAVGVVVSICSVRLRKATKRARKPVTMLSRCGRSRPSGSNFQTTRQSPVRANARARQAGPIGAGAAGLVLVKVPVIDARRE